MKNFKFNFALTLIIMLAACNESTSQRPNATAHVGGRCEGCEAIYENKIPFDQLDHVDTLPGFDEAKDRILIMGTVYQRDGKTPAKDVVLYVYHTDHTGRYPQKSDEKGWARRHGYMRGWIRTNDKGEYRFYTSRPGSYPNSSNPAHIHVTVKEPQLNEYYIDDFHFADDPLLTSSIRNNKKAKGGNGVVTLQMKNGINTATRNIILGLHVENYDEAIGK